MINPKHLRRGNIIFSYEFSKPVIVVSDHSEVDGYVYHRAAGDDFIRIGKEADFGPMLLTKEMVKRTITEPLNMVAMEDILLNAGLVPGDWIPRVGFKRITLKPITAIHEFQNLYFELFKQPLNITL